MPTRKNSCASPLFAPGPALLAPAVRSIPAPAEVLIVGNSLTFYNNSLHGRLRDLADSADPDHADSRFFRAMTISGGFLPEHKFGFSGMARSRAWNVIVLQGNSIEPVDPAFAPDFVAYSLRYCRTIRKVGALPALYMTWAYADRPEMALPLANAYTAIGNRTKSLVIPAGLAFAEALARRPEMALHVEDAKHPTLAGTYLAACTFYAALFGKSPAGIAYDAGLGSETALFLQTVARDTAAAYYGR